MRFTMPAGAICLLLVAGIVLLFVFRKISTALQRLSLNIASVRGHIRDICMIVMDAETEEDEIRISSRL